MSERESDPEAQAILDAAPEMDDAMGLCLTAWRDLSTCRAVGMSLGPIPWDKSIQWCEWHGLDRDATKLVIAVLQRLDRDRSEAEASKSALKGSGHG